MKWVQKEIVLKWQKFWKIKLCPLSKALSKKKSYNIHPLNNKIVEAFEILNAKTLLHALE